MSISQTAPLNRRKQPVWVSALALAWLAAVLGGTFAMIAYANSSGPAGTPPARWPEASRMRHDPNLPTLIMFVHPHCPCSSASVEELAQLMAHCQGRVAAHVLFLHPEGMDAKWILTETWHDAGQIPGVTVFRDEAGREARCFGAGTSGETVLYDTNGNLLFHGGITIARGHSGDNPGKDTVQALITGAPAKLNCTPTFGCSLFECKPSSIP
jgi:hypothetical protein